MKKIGILGSGEVGKSLAAGFINYGYEVMIGSRDPGKLKEWQQQNEKARIGNFNETAEFGEIIVLAVKGTGAASALEMAGFDNLAGKTIIDTTNPISDSEAPVNGVLRFFTNDRDSLIERLQEQVPHAHFVKAFNSIGSRAMVNPDFGGIKPTMFICGNNEEAKKEVTAILEQFGHETEDVGKATSGNAVESLCILWCIPGFLRNQWTHAFKLLKK